MYAKRIPWAAFEAAVRPVLESHIRELGRTPGQKKLRRLGHGWMVSAAHKHYGGWSKVLRRMKLPPAVRQPGHVAGYHPPGYWNSDERILSALRHEFPDLLAWDTMPSTKMLQAKVMGVWDWAARHGGVSQLCKQLGLMPYLDGMRCRRRIAGIDWALTFYETHRRWPHSSECHWPVRDVRFVRGTSWHDYCRPTGLPLAGLNQLIERVEQHVSFLQQHNMASKAAARRRVLNWLIVQRYHRFPLLP